MIDASIDIFEMSYGKSVRAVAKFKRQKKARFEAKAVP
jgi:hypothetical protein